MKPVSVRFKFQWWGSGVFETDRLFPAVQGGNKKRGRFGVGDLLVTDDFEVRDWLRGLSGWQEVESPTGDRVTHRAVKGAFV